MGQQVEIRLTRLISGWVGSKIATRLTKQVGFGLGKSQPVYKQVDLISTQPDPLPALGTVVSQVASCRMNRSDVAPSDEA